MVDVDHLRKWDFSISRLCVHLNASSTHSSKIHSEEVKEKLNAFNFRASIFIIFFSKKKKTEPATPNQMNEILYSWIWFMPSSVVHSTCQLNVNKLNGARDLRIFRVTVSTLLQQLHRAEMSFLFVNFLFFYSISPFNSSKWLRSSSTHNARLIFSPYANITFVSCIGGIYEKNRFTYFLVHF